MKCDRRCLTPTSASTWSDYFGHSSPADRYPRPLTLLTCVPCDATHLKCYQISLRSRNYLTKLSSINFVLFQLPKRHLSVLLNKLFDRVYPKGRSHARGVWIATVKIYGRVVCGLLCWIIFVWNFERCELFSWGLEGWAGKCVGIELIGEPL